MRVLLLSSRMSMELAMKEGTGPVRELLATE